ncbi:site-specific integrase [Kitasatospora phosalacinea]|uniref:site-specific integrase n=1 Tax=Kitasatospora phosalacinea TaxID=2065 RepID=UPI0012FF0DD0|nr:site-specific integrase [Kitasatospora phosalacinea]
MATTGLIRGMGSFFKECEHPESRWSKCPHEYRIRYRNATGQQTEESGFATQQKAMTRLAEVYHARKDSPQSQRKAERVQKYGGMQFSAYAAEWLKGQRHQGPASLRMLESTLKHHLLPTFGAQLEGIRAAGDEAFNLVAELMSGCGLRNGEALAVNVDNIVADDIYRVTEQVNQATKTYARLKHRKADEYRDVPLPARTKRAIEKYADTHGTVDGYLLRHPQDISQPMPHHTVDRRWRKVRTSGRVDVPEGMVLYGLRHFFASNCLSPDPPS